MSRDNVMWSFRTHLSHLMSKSMSWELKLQEGTLMICHIHWNVLRTKEFSSKDRMDESFFIYHEKERYRPQNENTCVWMSLYIRVTETLDNIEISG